MYLHTCLDLEKSFLLGDGLVMRVSEHHFATQFQVMKRKPAWKFPVVNIYNIAISQRMTGITQFLQRLIHLREALFTHWKPLLWVICIKRTHNGKVVCLSVRMHLRN
jgi:hypothetical protein